MRIMTLESSVAQEKYIHKELASSRVKITNSVQIFCKYLFDNAINQGRYYYPSLNTFKFEEKLSLSLRTVDRLVRFLAKVNILTKLPRSKTRSYQVNFNSPLFRTILKIYQPALPISISTKQNIISTKRIEELQKGLEHLKHVFSLLESKEDHRLELHRYLLDEITECTTVSDISTEDLKEKLRSIILGSSTSAEINKFSILNEFLLEYNKGD